MSSAWNKVQIFVQDVGQKVHNLDSDSLNFILTNVAPVSTNTAYSNWTDLSTGAGYTAGGTTIASTAYTETSGTATLTGSNVVFTATGSLGPLRYTPLYNDTASGKNALGWYDYGSSVTLASGETFTINISSGIFTMT
jgi:hypothetical protein